MDFGLTFRKASYSCTVFVFASSAASSSSAPSTALIGAKGLEPAADVMTSLRHVVAGLSAVQVSPAWEATEATHSSAADGEESEGEGKDGRGETRRGHRGRIEISSHLLLIKYGV